MQAFSVDAYKPGEIAARLDEVGVGKGHADSVSVFVLSILAGAFIALGAAFYTVVTHDMSGVNPGLMRLLGGLSFCLGLILVVIAGAELFTGNNLLVIAYVTKKLTLQEVLLNWTIVFFGNLVGALLVCALVYFAELWVGGGVKVGAKALLIAEGKVNLSFGVAFCRGLLCNLLVCLAVWICFAGRTVTDKILAIIFPITAFVALGLEHSVANMYFLSAGLLLVDEPTVVAAAAAVKPEMLLDNLTLSQVWLGNLLPVTLGNLVGGGFGVGLVYWFIYLRRK